MGDTGIDVKLDHEPIGRKIGQVTEAARRLFLEYGFSAISMDAVAKEAAVSKATLYSYFQSKEALFASLIQDECISKTIDLSPPTLDEGLEQGLRRFALNYVKMFRVRKERSLVRVLANENTRFPDLCHHFYEIGPLATTRRIAQFLLDARDAGLMSFDDAMIASTQFLSLIRGDLPLRAVFGIDDFNNETVETEVEAGLAMFLRAYRVETPSCRGGREQI